jgi:hypothetical protein
MELKLALKGDRQLLPARLTWVCENFYTDNEIIDTVFTFCFTFTCTYTFMNVYTWCQLSAYICIYFCWWSCVYGQFYITKHNLYSYMLPTFMMNLILNRQSQNIDHIIKWLYLTPMYIILSSMFYIYIHTSPVMIS